MPHLIALGHNIALGSLVAIYPQPRTIGYQHGRRSYAASGEVIDELDFVEFLFSVADIDSIAQYKTTKTQFGVLTAKTALVTVYTQDDNYDWIIRNGKAVQPLIGTDGERSDYFLRNFVFLVKDLRVQA